MGFQVALIDKSEIVQKMLSHCLQYFCAEVSRFDSLEDCQSHFTDKKPKIVFIDGEVKPGDSAVIHSAVKIFQPVPVVWLYRAGKAGEEAIANDKTFHKIKKPLEPKAVRDIFTELVPEIKESTIHPFLRFPKSKKGENEAMASNDPKNIKAGAVAPPPPQKDSKKLALSSLEDLQKDDGLIETTRATQTFLEKTLTGFVKEQPTAQKSATLDKSSSLSPKTTKKTTEVKSEPKTLVQKTAYPPKTKESELTKIVDPKGDHGTAPKINKEDLNINENTQNDLAPMAIKSSPGSLEKSKAIQNLELSEKDILRVLNKYKDSLEFQELMERVLSEHAKKAVTGLLQSHKTTDIMAQSLNTFKEGEKFKQLVEEEVTKFIQKHLPALIKRTVEREIQKIIGD